MTFPLKLGSQGQDVHDLDVAAVKRYRSYAFEADGVTPLKNDGYYGYGEQAFAKQWQTRMGRPATGQLSFDEWNYIVHGVSFPQPKINYPAWIYTCPGSGANWDVGPSFDLGNWVQDNIGIRHQPVYFQKGGYLGFMGGDPTFSYNDVIYDQYKSIEALLDMNPDVQNALHKIKSGTPPDQIKFDLWFSGYSQSADGLEDALEIIFGDGGFKPPKTGIPVGPGKYRALRPLIRRVVQFGNPSQQPDSDTGVPGWVAGGWGISRKIRPDWLKSLVVSITNPMDFYAAVPDSDSIRPVFYGEIVEANTSLPFFVHILNVAIPVILGAVPIFGGLLGPLAAPVVAAMAGLNQFLPLFTGLVAQGQQVNYNTDVDAKIEAMLTPTGILTNIPALIGLIGALPGLQNHGMYESPFEELGNRSGVQVACDIVRGFYGR
jgi:hypothetical protein